MPASPIFTFDGRNLKSAYLAGLNDAYFASQLEASGSGLGNLSIVGGLSTLRAYAVVPWLYRAVTKKAMLVSRMPFDLVRDGSDQDVQDDPAYASLMQGFRRKLYQLTISKLVTGGGYWYLDANAAGRNVTPRWLRPTFIQPYAPVGGRLEGFRFSDPRAPEIPRTIPLDRIVYSWEPNLADENKPGPSEVSVALGAASMLYALDAFTAGFFNSGGVKVTVFEVPQQMSETDKTNFQTFLNRAVSGVRNAFRNIAVRGGIKPTVIGSNIKETEAPELVGQQRESVAAALGFPPAAISGEHENRATAQIIALTVMTDSIIPYTDVLFEDFNEQLFSRFGLSLVSHPERLEVMQAAQLDQAQAVSLIVPGPPLTIDEGRELLGRAPLAEAPGVAGAGPRMDQSGAGGESEGELQPAVAALVAWRKNALEAVRTGQPVPLDPRYPWLCDRLENATTSGEVRKAFAAAWPRRSSQPPASSELGEAVAELKRYNDLAAGRAPE